MVSGHLHEKNGRFYVILNFVDDRGHRKPKWFSTGLPVKGNKRKAEAMLHELRQQYDSALLPVCNAPPRIDDTMQFADYMLYWLNIIRTEVEVDTYASYQSIIKQRIVPYFPQRQITLAQLRPVDIQDFYTYCMTEYGVSSNTVIHYHANLSKALKYALRKELIDRNPMDRVDRPKAPKHIGQFYSQQELHQLFQAVRGDGVEFPVLMAAFYGLRRSEIVGIQWKSVDFENNRLTIEHTVIQTRVDGKQQIIAKDRAKNKSSCRTLPLVPQYRELLLRMKAHQTTCRKLCGKSYHTSDYVYVNDIGQPYLPNYITQHFALVLRKNGLRKIRFHELRHSCASLLLKNGVSMKEIQEWLGHSDFTTTANIYAHLDSSAKESTGQVMTDCIDIGACFTPSNHWDALSR